MVSLPNRSSYRAPAGIRADLKLRWPIATLLATIALSAAAAQEPPSRYEQRQMYREALDALYSGQNGRFRELAEQLSDYPLAPYLEYFDKSRHIARYSYEEIATFTARHSDSPIAAQLLRSWLYAQARRGRWQAFVDHYDEERSSPILSCDHLYALYKTGQTERAMQLTSKQWLVDFSQPEECDPIFKVWREAGYLTDDRAWQRLEMSLQADNTTLATYLVRFLSRERRDAAQLFRQVHGAPQLLRDTRRFRADSPDMRAIILHGLRRLARFDASEALDLWRRYLDSHQFARAEADDLHLEIAAWLAAQGDPDNLLDTLPVDFVGHVSLLEARIRLALAREDWGQVLVFINALPDERQQIARWQFWKARVLGQSPDPADRESADGILRRLAARRGYYSFLAADTIGYPYAMENLPTILEREELSEVERLPGIERALELFALDERARARAEWRLALREFDDRALAAAARVAQNWGWWEQSIQTLIASERWDDLRVRFPLAYHDTFLAESREADIPVNWSLAIARQESAFMPDAKSTSGALGVMQLMPETARLTAERFDIPYDDLDDLIDPLTNISLGTAYLGQMFRRFANNRILASAAYNAGPSRVDRWLEEDVSDFDVWIETIPFTETRSYVQNILFFSVIFSYRLDQHQQMILPHEREQFTRWQVSRREIAGEGRSS